MKSLSGNLQVCKVCGDGFTIFEQLIRHTENTHPQIKISKTGNIIIGKREMPYSQPDGGSVGLMSANHYESKVPVYKNCEKCGKESLWYPNQYPICNNCFKKRDD